MPILLLLAFLAAISLAQPQPPFTDQRDGKSYRAVKIGEQVWMAENLNYEAESSKCYNNKAENCEKYGQLYNWNTAVKVCPGGWHLPSNKEWDILVNFVGGIDVAGKKLKAANGWNDNREGKPVNGEDKFGFAALPGGYGRPDGSFNSAGNSGNWWSATESGAYQAYNRGTYYYGDNFWWGYNGRSSVLYSVRCVRD